MKYLLAGLLLATAGCGFVERHYSWTRQEPAAGRSSPTTYVVRIQVDVDKREVRWIEDVHDEEGFLGRNMEAYTNCEMFNGRNWKCYSAAPESIWIEMTDGDLRQHYFDEDRRFNSRYSLQTKNLLP